jgi:hypothetical protein
MIPFNKPSYSPPEHRYVTQSLGGAACGKPLEFDEMLRKLNQYLNKKARCFKVKMTIPLAHAPVILSRAKDLHTLSCRILRFAQDDKVLRFLVS